MYDPAHKKEDYLKTIHPNSVTLYQALFRKFEKIESHDKKDIIDMDIEGIQRCLASIEYTTNSVLSNYKTILYDYFRFYENPLIEVFGLQEFKLLCKRSGRVLVNIDELLAIEKRVNEEVANHWYYNCILFLTFLGFKQDDFVRLRKSDIHMKQGRIIFSDGKVIDLTFLPQSKVYLQSVIDHESQFSQSDKGDLPFIGLDPDSVFRVQMQTRGKSSIAESIKKSISRTGIGKVQQVMEDKSITLKTLYDGGLIYYVKKKIAPDDLKNYLDVPKGDYRRSKIQMYIAAFGSTMKVEKFKFKFKDI